ncbi:hypothetical protein EHQ43_09935 [Leptospira bouyouniensis]|uniref:SIR2-like domain-containing protein n=1 Tax=Leptospira bouyouniensis TaxID=2484911 RepID=A0A7I0HSP6_9LEPT|nr:hypothetical protein [Leptospira bouyouniensis]TGL06707.1 hypothetical protein EHQ43_09935 [Leptospira bouyouniensis]
MKTLYLLGAGASATVVPTVQEMKENFEKIFDLPFQSSTLRDKMPTELLSDLRFLSSGIREYGTPDIFAKKAYLSNQTTEYLKIKRALSYYLMMIHIFRGIDSRYYAFLSALIEKRSNHYKLHQEVFVATWNYDLQFASALCNLTNKTIGYLNDRFDKLTDDAFAPPNTSKQFFRLNGYAGSHLYFNNSLDASISGEAFGFIYENISQEEKLTRLFDLYDHFKSKESDIKYNICFAWDKRETDHPSKEDLFDSISEVEVLIVIGYSFPNFNRSIDRRIIRSMPKLRKIYLQDKINYMESRILPLVPESVHLERSPREFISELSQFFIPPELGDF